jgi:transposase
MRIFQEIPRIPGISCTSTFRRIREIRKLGEDQWKNIYGYRNRWTAEIYFSGFKRVMGEIIRAERTDYMIHEVGLKVLYYNIMRNNTKTYG